MDFADRIAHHPPTSVPARMLRCMWRQSRRNLVCPDTPRLDGARALVTGGNRGIGLETSRGLARRGAEIVLAARGEESGKRAAETLRADFRKPAQFVALDLGDLRAMPRTLDRIEGTLEGQPLDVLVANAGLWPTRHARSAQGHEIAFATNVLGHHALVRGLQARGLLAESARVVIVTGDIYVMSRDCTPDFAYRGAWGGQLAYCRSKLGNLWQGRELARRHPALRVHVVHPGVVATDLGGSVGGAAAAMKRAILLAPEQGAQTTLFCATQHALESGAYYHNTLGRVELRPEDPAADDVRAAAFWELLESLAAKV